MLSLKGMKSAFKIVMVFCILSMFCCNNKARQRDVPPANILDAEKFTVVLVDFALAESVANMNIKNAAVTKTDSVYAFNPLNENGVRQSQYDSTLNWYSHHPAEYKKVYEKVLDRLTELKTEQKWMKDSLEKK